MSPSFRNLLIASGVTLGAIGAYWTFVRGGPGQEKAPSSSPEPGGLAEAPASPPKPTGVFLDPTLLEDGGVSFAQQYTGPIPDPQSLTDLRDAILARGRLGLAVIGAELDQVHLGPQSPPEKKIYAAQLQRSLGLLQMHEGRLDEASREFADAESLAKSSGMAWKERLELTALRGIVALRQGELDNCIACLGASSCIFPILPEATHKNTGGSREAIEHFTAYLDELPGDLRIRWLLNLAYMTLGEYPAKVPPEYLVPIDWFRSKEDVGHFLNVALTAGLTVRGPNLAGGSIFDDFTGDGRPDLFTTSLDATRGASFFVNKGDGTFDERSREAGLDDQIYALNVVRGDFDNDGNLDVVLLRGGWEKPMRMSLLRNRGDATFEDVTIAAGLGEPISSESAGWGDFDNDGFVDLYVCGEYRPPGGDPPSFTPDPRNHGRLYRNKGDGTFEDVAEAAGVRNDECGKGCAWGDYDDDGKLDLFISNMSGPGRLYRNKGDGTFEDMAPKLGVTADFGFACWFWDYDNDGRLDLLVNGMQSSLSEEVGLATGDLSVRKNHPRLYRNLGAEGFRDATADVGLASGGTPMGCNFGDFDNDGWLDMYLGTGGMSFSHLTPNLMYRNVKGRQFEDVTISSGTGHLQKGHGISFADYDGDGDLDLFCEAGGAVPGDASHNALFRNDGNGGGWLAVKLEGTRTNRAALGAKVKATLKGPDGEVRALYRRVGDNSSFGGNPLEVHLGLGDAEAVTELVIRWPAGGTQTLRDLPAGRRIRVTEGTEGFEAVEFGAAKTASR